MQTDRSLSPTLSFISARSRLSSITDIDDQLDDDDIRSQTGLYKQVHFSLLSFQWLMIFICLMIFISIISYKMTIHTIVCPQGKYYSFFF